MLKELFEAVVLKGVQAEQLPIVEDNVRFTVRLGRDGKEIITKHAAPLIWHEAGTIDDIIRFAEKYGQQGELWHNIDYVTLVVDANDRRETVRLKLDQTEQFLLLKKQQRYNQRAFERLLRFQLRDCVSTGLAVAVQRLNFITSGRDDMTVAQGREKGTREFAVELAGETVLPEVVNASVSVYSTAGLRTPRIIRLGLDYSVPPAQVEFQLVPLGDEISVAIENAQAELHQLLRKAVKIPVFTGTPCFV